MANIVRTMANELSLSVVAVGVIFLAIVVVHDAVLVPTSDAEVPYPRPDLSHLNGLGSVCCNAHVGLDTVEIVVFV